MKKTLEENIIRNLKPSPKTKKETLTLKRLLGTQILKSNSFMNSQNNDWRGF